MQLIITPWIILATYISEVLAASQVPLEVPEPETRPSTRKLHGRFLHITDIHPDSHYKYEASRSSACHRKKPKKEKKRAGYYGAPFSECDSPFALTNFTLDYLEKHWSSEIDFVIWTGDNARHDNDRDIPRTPDEIYDLNRAVAAKMHKVFASKGIPVIPSLGNNDVWPHNIMEPGPNSITNTFSSIWKSYIPFPAYQVFQRGAYYSVEVIPNALAVISLNTMYFYDSNKAVEGCPYIEAEDPGNLEFDWLKVQLESFRDRNVKVWLSGHVPPSPRNYFPECYTRYVELALRFQDTILGHLFGHMNADHFSLMEARDLEIWPEEDSTAASGSDNYSIASSKLYDSLLDDFEEIDKIENKSDYDDFAIVNVSPSVVPNPYLPSFRIFAYNITGAENALGAASDEEQSGFRSLKRKHGHHRGRPANKDEKCKESPYRDTWTCHLDEEWYSDSKAPSRTNTLWTPLGYAQYYIPKLDDADEKHEPKFKLEYMTFPLYRLLPADQKSAKGFHYPIPLKQLPHSLRDGKKTKSKFAPYEMEDLTIPSWIQLARKLAKASNKKLRKKFRKYMYMGSKDDE